MCPGSELHKIPVLCVYGMTVVVEVLCVVDMCGCMCVCEGVVGSACL